jgi:phosphohistidine phosphatase
VARELWLLRHGDAEPADGGADAQRPLSHRGREQSAAAGRALAALELAFSAVLTSPRVRAAETAGLACEPLGAEPATHAALSGGFEAGEALALVAAAPDGGRLLLVGHEPDFSQVVHDLTGARVDLKKGGVAAVALDGARGELIALMRPRDLRAIAGAG